MDIRLVGVLVVEDIGALVVEDGGRLGRSLIGRVVLQTGVLKGEQGVDHRRTLGRVLGLGDNPCQEGRTFGEHLLGRRRRAYCICLPPVGDGGVVILLLVVLLIVGEVLDALRAVAAELSLCDGVLAGDHQDRGCKEEERKLFHISLFLFVGGVVFQNLC